jgi:hypothetical protein
MREAKQAMDYVDVDKDGKIGLLDYIHFAARLKDLHEANKYATLMSELKEKSGSEQDADDSQRINTPGPAVAHGVHA